MTQATGRRLPSRTRTLLALGPSIPLLAAGAPARWAMIVLQVDGHRHFGSTLAWLTDGRAVSDHEGFRSAPRIPGRPLSVLSWSRHGAEEGLAGTFASLAVAIHPPLAEALTLKARR